MNFSDINFDDVKTLDFDDLENQYYETFEDKTGDDNKTEETEKDDFNENDDFDEDDEQEIESGNADSYLDDSLDEYLESLDCGHFNS